MVHSHYSPTALCCLSASLFPSPFPHHPPQITQLINVGYLNNELKTDGQNMKCAPFVNITEQDGIKLSDISVKGYYEKELGGCWGNVSIARIGSDGVCDKLESGLIVRYYWFDEVIDEEVYYAPGWYDFNEKPLKDNASELGNADEIMFDVGDGFVVYADYDYIGCTLDAAGQVFGAAKNYPLPTDGQNYVGNPNPVSVYLSQLSVSGYYEADLGGCWGNVSIAMIGSDGVCDKLESGLIVRYYWFDEVVDEEVYYAAGWYDFNEKPLKDNASELGNADKIEFKPGQGLVVYADYDYIGCTLNFPAVKINN